MINEPGALTDVRGNVMAPPPITNLRLLKLLEKYWRLDWEHIWQIPVISRYLNTQLKKQFQRLCTNLKVASHPGQKRRQRFILLIPQLPAWLPPTCGRHPTNAVCFRLHFAHLSGYFGHFAALINAFSSLWDWNSYTASTLLRADGPYSGGYYYNMGKL